MSLVRDRKQNELDEDVLSAAAEESMRIRSMRVDGVSWLLALAQLALAAGCAGSDNKSAGSSPLATVGPVNGSAGASATLPSTGPGNTALNAGSTGQIPATGVPCNVAAVVSNNCTLCHAAVPAFSAPMSLMTYADFHALAKTDATRQVYQVIPERIHATDIKRRMPPASNNALSASDLQVLSDWVTGGAVASAQSCPITAKNPDGTQAVGSAGAGSTGPVGSAGAGSVGSAGAGSTGPTTTSGGASSTPRTYNDPMMMCYKFLAHDPGSKTTPFAVTTTPDQYTNFTFMPEWQGMQYARSYSIVLGNMQVIHHWLFYKDSTAGPDGDVAASIGAHPNGELVDGWAPGGSPLYFDDDTGEEMPGDVAYTLETHHNNTTGATAPDASGIEVCVTPAVPTNVASLSWLGTDAINGTMASGTCVPNNTGPIHILGGTPHMHTKGIRQSVIITRANGMQETLHDQPFDFGNQHSYMDQTIINPGDSLTTTCYWNAPASFGEKTSDEMCYYFTLYYPKLSLTNGNPVATLIHGDNNCLDP